MGPQSVSRTSVWRRTAPRSRGLQRLDGLPTVGLEVRRQSGANTSEVIKTTKESLARATAQLPSDVRVEIIRDQSRYINAALHEINLHLVLGALACLVVLAFMRSWRSTFIAGVAIPVSVISTFGMMAALGFTLNSVTMLALVLMVGIVIDDAIVVLENIFRFVEEKKMRPFEAARGNGGDRTGGYGDHAESGGHLRARVLYVEYLGTLPLPVRHYGRCCSDGESPGLLHADPNDECRLLRAEDTAGGHDASRSRRGFYAWIDWAYAACWPSACGNGCGPSWRSWHSGLSIPLYRCIRC